MLLTRVCVGIIFFNSIFVLILAKETDIGSFEINEIWKSHFIIILCCLVSPCLTTNINYQTPIPPKMEKEQQPLPKYYLTPLSHFSAFCSLQYHTQSRKKKTKKKKANNEIKPQGGGYRFVFFVCGFAQCVCANSNMVPLASNG
ncbi:hypothetical protein QBC41DRAFT_108753 [Cercophora samala]|uniref:Uncharacterized protein n=1 Tax=Cercophora samala TaxID=330535 RepID=A0AA39ZED7_9PEZI|nr:hypothetical protein QBC41DRAFT_108753 [Cercophora samala]